MHALVAAHRAMERSSNPTSTELKRRKSLAETRPPRAPLCGRMRATGSFIDSAETSKCSMGYKTAVDTPHKPQSNLNLRRVNSSLASTAPKASSETSETFVGEYKWSPPCRDIEPGRRPSESYGAEPSSFRRLRKAKSLLTPRRSLSIQNIKDQLHLSPPKALRNAHSSLGFSNRLRVHETGILDNTPRLKKSRSIFRFSHRTNSRVANSRENEARYSEEAVRIARAEFLKGQIGNSNQDPVSRPQSRKRRTFSRLRVGVRSEKQLTGVDNSPSRLRSLSASLRDRIHGMFGRAPSHKSGLPPQQLEASRRYFGEPSDADAHGFDAYHVDESGRRNSLYHPSDGNDDALEDLDKISDTLQRADSQSSLHSAARSRVTSWTNSTVTGNGSLRLAPLQHNRLSIIKEDGGPHQPSSSAGRHIGGVSAFQEPIDAEAVDSQRIYSALMRRIDREDAEMNLTQRELDEIHSGQQRMPATIRPVPSEASLKTIQHAPDPEHREFSVGNSNWHTGKIKYNFSDEDNTPSPDYEKEGSGSHQAQLAAQETQSSFFPFSGGEQKPKGLSPFKHILMQKRREENKISEESDSMHEFANDKDDNRPVAQSRPTTRSKDNSKSASHASAMRRAGVATNESMYSRSTGGTPNTAYIRPSDSTEDSGLAASHPKSASAFGRVYTAAIGSNPYTRRQQSADPNTESEHGMATILPDRINRYPRPSERVGKLVTRQNSSASSGIESREWRGWMEKQLGNVSAADNDLEWQRSRSSDHGAQGHFREHAQIDGEDVEVGKEDGLLGKTQKRFPLLELKEVSRGNTPTPRRDGSGMGLVKSRSGLLLKAAATEESKSGMRTLRKISPGNVAKILKTKGSGLLTSANIRSREKENKTPTPSVLDDVDHPASFRGKKDGSESPPVSTPGRLMLAYSKHNNGRVRSKKNDLAATPKTGSGKRYQFAGGDSPASSSSYDKHGSDSSGGSAQKFPKGISLSARLSRPFDMDVPGHNRPFDSMYLGKRPTKDTEGAKGAASRLSVAPAGTLPSTHRGPGGYGGLGTPSPIPTPTPEDIKVLGHKLSSRRMVSDFLKRLRGPGEDGGASADEDGMGAIGSPPAFV